MNDIRKKAKDYAKVKHKEEYNDPAYHRDVVETINDFEAGYKKALAISRVVGQSEQLPNMTLEQAIEKAKPNLDKIKDVDKHLDDIR